MAKKELKGIGGWLLVYVILGLWAGITWIVAGSLAITDGVYSSFISYGMLIFGTFWIYTILQILRKKKKAIDMTIYLLWVAIAIAIAGLFSLGISEYSFLEFIQFIAGTIVYIVVIQYFKRSLRVKKTLVN